MNTMTKADMTGSIACHIKRVGGFPPSFIPIRSRQERENLGPFLNLDAANAGILIGRAEKRLYG